MCDRGNVEVSKDNPQEIFQVVLLERKPTHVLIIERTGLGSNK